MNQPKNALKNLQERLFKHKVDSETAQIRSIILVMQEFKMSWEEVNSLPITTFKFIVKMLDDQNKEMERKYKKK
jgi:hypothetical protein